MITSTFTTVHGYRLHALEAGTGPPVCLLHGFAGTAELWRPTLCVLARHGYRAIAIDALGFGHSEKPGDAPYSLSFFADLYAGLLDAFGLAQSTFVAHSMGGKSAMAMAILRPQRVSQLILVDSDGFIKPSPLTKAGGWPLLGPAMLWLSSRTVVVRALLSQAFHHPRAYVTPKLVAQARATLQGSDNWRALRAISRRYDDTDLWHTGLRFRLGEIRCPTLIIWGAEDRIFAPEYAQIARREIPGARLVYIPDCGHFPQIEAARAFHGLLVGVLARS